jgi:hypothetical protein
MRNRVMLGLGVLVAAAEATADPLIHFRATALVFPPSLLSLPPTTVTLDYSFADAPPVDVGDDSATYQTLGSGAMTAELAQGTDASSFSCDGVAIEVVNDGPAGDDYLVTGEDCRVGVPPQAVDQLSLEIADPSGALFASTALPLEPPPVAAGTGTLVARWDSNSVTLPILSLESVPEPDGAELAAILALGACLLKRAAAHRQLPGRSGAVR